MAFKQWFMGTPHIPLVDDYHIRQILSYVGQEVIHKSKRTASKCDCWNTVYGHPDRNCSVCGGSGYFFVERKMKCYIEQYPPLGRGQIGDYVTQAGMVQRYTHRLFTYGWEHKNVAVNDIIVFPTDINVTRFEHDVILNECKWGSYGQTVYTELRILRKPYTETGIVDPIKPMA